MRYQSRSAISYMFRNFWRLAMVALPVALFHGFFANYASESDFLAKLVSGNLSEDYVSEFTAAFTVVKYGSRWWIPFVLPVAMSITQSFFCVMISRHLRMGEMNVSLSKVFSVLPTMLLYMSAMYVCSIALDFIPSGMAMLLSGIIGNAQLVCWLCVVFSFAFSVLIAYVFVSLICAFPIRYCDNYPFNVALSYSARIVNKNGKNVALLSFMFPVCQVIVATLCAIVGNEVFSVVAYTLLFLFFTVYVPCVAFTMYYELIGRERKDISRIIFG